MNKSTCSILIISLLIFNTNLHTHASTSTLGTQNTFGASASGHSTENDQNSKLDREHQQDLQKLDVHQQVESKMNLPIEKPTPLKHLVNSYQRTIELLIQKNTLTLEILKQVIQDKNIYFENIPSLSMDLNANIFLQNLAMIKKNVIALISENEFQTIALDILENNFNNAHKSNKLLTEIKEETKEIFYPHILSKQKMSDIFKNVNTIQYDFYIDNQGDYIAVLTENESSVIYLYNVTKNKFIQTIDIKQIALKTQNKLQQLPSLVLKNNHVSHAIVKDKGGQNMILFHSSDFKIYFIDLETGTEIHKPLYFPHTKPSSKLHPKPIHLKNGETVVLAEATREVVFIDIHTGKFLESTENSENLFNKFFNFTKKSIKIKKPYASSREVFLTTLPNGEEVLILLYDDTIIFIDPLTFKEKYKKSLIYKENNNFFSTSFIITLNKKKYLYLKGTSNLNHFIDLETGQPIEFESLKSSYTRLIHTEKFQSEINFQIINDFRKNEVYFLDILTGHSTYPTIKIPETDSNTENYDFSRFSFVFKDHQNQLLLALFTNKNIYILNIKSGEILSQFPSLDFSSRNIREHMIIKNNFVTFYIQNSMEKLYFNSIHENTHTFTEITLDKPPFPPFFFMDPTTNKEYVFIGVSEYLNLISFSSTTEIHLNAGGGK